MVGNPPTRLSAQAMNTSANTLILVLSEAENIAKRIENHLRNAGHPIRTLWAATSRDLEKLISQNPPDLLLCALGLPQAPFTQVMEQCRSLNPDLPVLLLTPRYAADNTLMALDAGARDHVSYEDSRYLRHLEQVCLRELSAYQNFRKLELTQQITAEVETRSKQLISESTDAVATVSEGIIIEINPAFVQMLKHKNSDELVGQPLMDLVAPDAQARIKEHLKLLAKGKANPAPVACGLCKADKSVLAVNISFSISSVGGESLIQLLVKAPVAAVTTVAEVAAGRIPYMKRLKAAIAEPRQAAQAALVIAVDEFHALEARLGLGDSEEAVLKLMDWIRSRMTANETLVRVSSGEMALIVQRPDVRDIADSCDKLRREIQKQVFVTRNNEAHLTVSIAAYPFGVDDKPDHILGEVTQAARQLSSSGGNQFIMLGPVAQSAEVAHAEAQQAATIKKAIDENRLHLAYQSISSLEGDPRQHMDILLRMMDEAGKEIAAAEFIQIAEKFNLTCTLDRWVTTTVLKALARRKPNEEASTLFVKISEETLKDAENFVIWLRETLKTHPLHPGELVFSFQESRLQNHIRKGKALTKALHDLGAGIAIEHFGKSSNSLQLMDHITANFIKLDASFTRDFADKAVLKTMTDIMEVAKRRQIKTIVCHVEDANVMARLWQMGVNFIQGFLVQEPTLTPGQPAR
jgi:EAL domain-containing protein (putative c-di-GMP-specific phosphodiesterase class I)/PleD family two-component response regulator